MGGQNQPNPINTTCLLGYLSDYPFRFHLEEHLSSFYVTTPLYYVNDKPHLGHAYTTIAADVLNRWHRLMGKEAHFLTGTDEHGQKVFEAAERRGITPKEHCDEMALPFRQLWQQLGIENDDFIRTTEPRHTTVVQAVLQRLFDSGDIYEAEYEGWYSTSAERFWTEKDLVDGKCPDSGLPVEWISEKNYFFRMSNYTAQLQQWIEDRPTFIRPSTRRNEVLGYLRKDVGDLCISRPKQRLPWGISLPFDDGYVTYVWFDALLNYITALGYDPALAPENQPDAFKQHWPAQMQIVGKDILTTHSVYWSTMLFALGLEPAECLFAHGWWTVEGRKMSKSLGNVIDPNLLIDCYGADPLRYYVLREFPFGGDGNFSHDGFMVRFNADLANDFGNLAHRAFSMTERWLGGVVPALDPNTEADDALDQALHSMVEQFTEQLESLQFSVAIETLWTFVRLGNKYIDQEQPWRHNREGNTTRLGGVMRRCLEICRVAATLVSPIMPSKSAQLLSQLGAPEKVNLAALDGLSEGVTILKGEPLFPRMKELPERIQMLRAETLGEDAAALKGKSSKAEKSDSGPKKIKLKVFQRVPFQAGKITAVNLASETQQLVVSTGESSTLTIEGTGLVETDGEALIGNGVVIVGPTTEEQFERIQLLSGQILSAAQHPDADKLLVLSVDLGETEPRSVVAGIANRFKPEELVNQRVTAVANLKPSKMRGVPSLAMLLAAGGEQLQSMVTPPESVGNGVVIERFGSGETQLLALRSNDGLSLLGLSEPTIPGSIVR